MKPVIPWLLGGLLLTACGAEPTAKKAPPDTASDASLGDINVGDADAGGDAQHDPDITGYPADTAADRAVMADTAADTAVMADTVSSSDTGAAGCVCDDNNPCTDDSCINGTCAHTANTASCDDGKSCTGGDVCAAGVCAGTSLYWTKTYGGSGEDVGRSAVALADGGLYVVGHSDGGGVASQGKGGRDAWLLRIDVHGELIWEQLVGDDLDQTAYDVATWDQKFATVGAWREHGDKQLHGWLHVTDGAGKAIGSHVFGKDEITELHAIAIGAAASAPTIRIVVAGYSEDANGDFALAVSRIDPGTLKPLWIKKHGTTGFDVAWDVVTLHNGNIGLVGDTAPGGSGPHVWLLELDQTGKIAWQRTYFGDGEDTGWSLVATPDATQKNVAYTVAGSRKKSGAPSTTAWLMHADAAGKDLWQETATAPGGAAGYDLAQLQPGGFLVAGRSAKTTGNDAALLWRATAAGATQWSLSVGLVGSVGYGAVVWSDGVGMVGQGGSGKSANLLVVRAGLLGSLVCL